MKNWSDKCHGAWFCTRIDRYRLTLGQNSTLRGVKTTTISRVIRNKKQRLEVVRGVCCSSQWVFRTVLVLLMHAQWFLTPPQTHERKYWMWEWALQLNRMTRMSSVNCQSGFSTTLMDPDLGPQPTPGSGQRSAVEDSSTVSSEYKCCLWLQQNTSLDS